MSTFVEVNKYLERNIPREVRLLLIGKMATLRAVQETMLRQEDDAHRMAHVLDVLNVFNLLAEVHDLDAISRDLGQRVIRLHDTGNRFVPDIKPEHHHFGSMILASIVDPDIRVLKGIKAHILDVFPKNSPLWIRLVRDADRIAALGFGGANRLARFFGFVDPEIDVLGQEEMVRRGIYCDLRHTPQAGLACDFFNDVRDPKYWLWWIDKYPYYGDYEKKAADYFATKVMPFMHKHGKAEQFGNYLYWVYRRFGGGSFEIANEDRDFVGFGDGNQTHVVIEPVVSVANRMYELKASATRTISSVLLYRLKTIDDSLPGQEWDYKSMLGIFNGDWYR